MRLRRELFTSRKLEIVTDLHTWFSPEWHLETTNTEKVRSWQACRLLWDTKPVRQLQIHFRSWVCLQRVLTHWPLDGLCPPFGTTRQTNKHRSQVDHMFPSSSKCSVTGGLLAPDFPSRSHWNRPTEVPSPRPSPSNMWELGTKHGEPSNLEKNLILFDFFFKKNSGSVVHETPHLMTMRTEDNDVKGKAETFKREGSLEEGQFVSSCFFKAKSKSKSMLNDLWMLPTEMKSASWLRIPEQRWETRSDELSVSW